MFDAIASGEIKALWVMGTNPAVSLPRADFVRAALAKLEFYALSEVVSSNDSSASAHVRLPAHGWSEKDGTVTNSERRISRQRGFLKAAGDARPDWWILSHVATRLGWGDAFGYSSPAEIFREHAALSGFENSGERIFDISGLSGLSDDAYADLAPIQWPIISGHSGTQRVFADAKFARPNGKAQFVPVSRGLETASTSDAWPMLLNTGRIRDQWHTMTRTGLTARLAAHLDEPFVEMHPDDARAANIVDDGIAVLESAHGTAVVRARVTDRVQPGQMFAPIHWSAANSSAGRIGALVHSTIDPISGQPDSKATPARISAAKTSLYGFLLSIDPPELPPCSPVFYWATSRIDTGFLTKFALDQPFAAARVMVNALLLAGERISYSDEAQSVHRSAALRHGRVEGIAFIGRDPSMVPTTWLKAVLGRDALSAVERRGLLAGGLADVPDTGPIVCVCHQVGAQTIAAAIANGCDSATKIGAACAAGTNCGSCLPELNRMLVHASHPRRIDALNPVA
jgi:assimilatory nitrate reductase catalytic subunit